MELIDKIKEYVEEKKQEESDEMMRNFSKEKEPNKRKLKKRINQLENENEVLTNAIKDELYRIFMDKLGEPGEIARYKKENSRLRKQVKTLKEIIKNG